MKRGKKLRKLSDMDLACLFAEHIASAMDVVFSSLCTKWEPGRRDIFVEDVKAKYYYWLNEELNK